uniref:Galectin n=1 Tax=Parastrongyloides trichosuri TaxID=131310 RepID=A0A0N4ZNT6_PARTI
MMQPTAPMEPTYNYAGPAISTAPAPTITDFFFPTVKFGTALNGFTFPIQIRIIGKVPEKGDRFEVNFVTSSDTAFHFNPRFKEKVIVRNNTSGGKWQHEERSPKGNPFEKNKIFVLDFDAQKTHVNVRLNGKDITQFAFRDNSNSIVGLDIQGDIELTLVSLIR